MSKDQGMDSSWHGLDAKCGECGAVGQIYQHGINASACRACEATFLSRGGVDDEILVLKSNYGARRTMNEQEQIEVVKAEHLGLIDQLNAAQKELAWYKTAHKNQATLIAQRDKEIERLRGAIELQLNYTPNEKLLQQALTDTEADR